MPSPPSTSKQVSKTDDLNLGALFKSKKPRISNLRVKNSSDPKRSGWEGTPTHSAVVLPSSQLKKPRTADSVSDPFNFTNAELLNRSKTAVLYKADETTTMQSSKRDVVTGATATTNIDGDLKNVSEDETTPKEVVAATEDSTYSGKKGYNVYLQKREGTRDSKKKTGPIRAPSHLRITSRFDYAPDICKDYKETGFCGYGDSCKFLHDRGDYKAGWQIDQEWELEQAAKREERNRAYNKFETGEEGSSSDSDQEEEFPFACLICRQSFTNPVVTKCGHYFCESCALQSYAKTPKCQACGAGTQGIFDTAKRLIERLNTMKPNERDTDPEETGTGSSPQAISLIGYNSDSSEP